MTRSAVYLKKVPVYVTVAAIIQKTTKSETWNVYGSFRKIMGCVMPNIIKIEVTALHSALEHKHLSGCCLKIFQIMVRIASKIVISEDMSRAVIHTSSSTHGLSMEFPEIKDRHRDCQNSCEQLYISSLSWIVKDKAYVLNVCFKRFKKTVISYIIEWQFLSCEGYIAMHVSKCWLRGASGRNCYSSCLEKQSNKMKHHTPLITIDKSCSRFIFWKVGVSLQSRPKKTTFSRSIFLKTAVGERGGVGIILCLCQYGTACHFR